MSELEWLQSIDPVAMLEFLDGKVSNRQQRLFAAACCRRIWQIYPDDCGHRAIAITERDAEGEATADEVANALGKLLEVRGEWREIAYHAEAACDFCDSNEYSSAVAINCALSAARTALTLHLGAPPGKLDPVDALLGRACGHAAGSYAKPQFYRTHGDHDWESAGNLGNAEERAEWPAQARLLRHIFGNPFRPYPGSREWPAATIELARALQSGADCAFALHDALLEAGHPELAEHFRQETEHPKGCWVLDLIMGRS